MREASPRLKDPLFGEHPEFPRLLAGAHRRRVTPMGSPALVRHVAFWNPTRAGPERTDDETVLQKMASQPGNPDPNSIARRARMADATIQKLYASLCVGNSRSDHIITLLNTNSEIVHEGRRLVVLFSGGIRAKTGAKADLPPEVQPDSYRGIKVRFHWRGITTSLNFELHTEFLAMTMIVDASPHRTEEEIEKGKALYGEPFADLLTCLEALSNDDLPEDEYKNYHRFLYHDVWDRFGDEVLGALQGDLTLADRKFVDFRGLVLGAQDPQGSGLARAFSRLRRERTTGKEQGIDLNMDRFDSLWKFMISSLPSETEYTLSKFLGGRAFYATALGSQSDALSARATKPLYYLIYESTQNDWQLGRLVYRVHRAGTARIGATMQFEELRKANETLSVIEEELEERIPLLLETRTGHDTNVEFRNSLGQLYRQVEARMGQLSANIDGTLEARVERSRYYVKQFFTVTKALRIDRFRGFQQYDEFVLQRVGPVFEYIDGVGRKFERVHNDRALLLGRIQTLDALILQEQISQSQRIAVRQQDLIVDAQKIADIALSCVLGPYYVGAILAHSAIFGHDGEVWVWRYAVVFGLAMFLMLVLQLPRPGYLGRWIRFIPALIIAFLAVKGWQSLEAHDGVLRNLITSLT
jgi:hypothetical protein